MALNYFASTVFIHATHNHVALLPAPSSSPEPLKARRRALLSNVSLVSISAAFSTSTIPFPFSAAASSRNEFSELPNSGGVKALDLRIGSGDVPVDGDQVASLRVTKATSLSFFFYFFIYFGFVSYFSFLL